MKLSNNFYLSEFEKSNTADKERINNEVGQPQIIDNLRLLCENILQLVRNNFGRVDILSGYRSHKLNRRIGGATWSQHLYGEAADFEVFGVSNKEVAQWIADNCDFDQLILEYYEDGIINSGWIHVSYSKQENRGELLKAYKNGKSTEYKKVEKF